VYILAVHCVVVKSKIRFDESHVPDLTFPIIEEDGTVIDQ